MDDREQIKLDLDPDVDKLVAEMVANGDEPFDVAKKIAAAARGLAPVVEGSYRDGIHAVKSPHGAAVIASDNKSAWVEFGIPSHNQPAQFVLRRAVDQVGATFTKRKG